MLANRLNITALIAGLIFIATGILFLLDEYDVLDLDAIFILPVLIIGLGLAIILGARTSNQS